MNRTPQLAALTIAGIALALAVQSASWAAAPGRGAAAGGRGGAGAGAGGGTPGMTPITLETDEILPPEIKTSLGVMPGAKDLPVRKELPDVMTMNDGTKVTTKEQWAKRRDEMKTILEYYAVGQAPPPPDNLKATIENTQDVGGGKFKYRLIKLTFGPKDKPEACSLEFGLWTPASGPPVGVVIAQDGSAPGAQSLPNFPQGVNQGRNQDVFSAKLAPLPATDPVPGGGGGRGGRGAGGAAPAAPGAPGAPGAPALQLNFLPDDFGLSTYIPVAAPGAPAPGGAPARGGRGGRGPEGALTNQIMSHGYAYVTYNSGDCAEDNTGRFADGSFSFRHSRFFPAYPNYDWGVLRAWAWGASRIIDYLVTDPAIDKTKIAITGVSRNGKSSLIAGAFDDRITLVAPVASSGGGTPAFRFSGFEHGGNEGLSEMSRKYPNWFSPHLHEFFHQAEKLPFDNHWYLALCAPRATVCLEGSQDQNVNKYGLRQSYLAAQPAFEFLGVKDRLETNWAPRPHGIHQVDWDGLFAMADLYWQNKPNDHQFNLFPPEAMVPPAAIPGAAQ